MNFRLKTDDRTAELLKSLYASTRLTPNILSRLAISLSLKVESMPERATAESGGIEFNRNTLTGDQDYIFKLLIRQHAGKAIEEEEYFPDLFNAHLKRGIEFLNQEYQHSGNYDKFLANLMKIID